VNPGRTHTPGGTPITLSGGGGAAQNAFLSGGVFQPRMFAGGITYTLGGTPITFAQREPYGKGCYDKFRSFYEFFPSSANVDFSNTSMRLTFDGANNLYVATAGTTPIQTVTSPSLGHLDNTDIPITLANSIPILFPNAGGTGTTTTVTMNSNGYICLNVTVAPVNNPTIAAWLTGATARLGNHQDFDPTTVGTTHYD